MGRKNRARNHDHHHGSTTHHHDHDKSITEIDITTEVDIEIESSGEVIEKVEVQEYISTTGRGLSDYPVIREFDTPEQIERRRQATIDEQQAAVSMVQNDEDVQIDRYRAFHQPSHKVGLPHTMTDDEHEGKPSDAYNELTPDGDKKVRRNAHEVVGFKQAATARHAAIKRLMGLSEDDKTLSAASPIVKK